MTPESESIYIYRRGKDERAMRLYRETDWFTGLSFTTTACERCLKFHVGRLRESGYMIRFDGEQLITRLFTGEFHLKDGQPAHFGTGHVSLYLSDQARWDAWYRAEVTLLDADDGVSEETQRLFSLRE